MPEGQASKPLRILDGIRILDLTRFLSGPQATLFLAALGAEVIRIDDPATGNATADAPPFFGPEGVSLDRRTPDDLGIAYLKRSRGKKAITLNLKSDRGKEIFSRLVRAADVVVENFRVGVTERLGIDYPKLRGINPKLIHCSITGYGSTGPDRRLKAFDLMIQAATGLMSVTGEPGGPACKTGSPLSDGIASSFAVSGILGALFHRQNTGEGQFVDVSMADCLVSLMLDEPFDCYERLGLPLRQGNRIMRFSPFNAYAALDGEVAIGVGSHDDWVALLEIMGRQDMLTRNDFMSASWRIANNSKVDEEVSAWTQTMTVAEIVDQLTKKEIPCSPIRDIEALAAWPHLRARGMLQELSHPAISAANGPLAPAFPLKFSEVRTDYQTAAPLVRQHNDEIYRGLLDMSESELRGLASEGVI